MQPKQYPAPQPWPLPEFEPDRDKLEERLRTSLEIAQRAINNAEENTRELVALLQARDQKIMVLEGLLKSADLFVPSMEDQLRADIKSALERL